MSAESRLRARSAIRFIFRAACFIVPCWFATNIAWSAEGSDLTIDAAHTSCSPSIAVLADLGVIRELHNAMHATPGWYGELTTRVEGIAARHASDIFIQRERDSWIFRSPSRRGELLLGRQRDYETARTPGAAYLLGRVHLLERAPETLDFLKRAVASFPSFAPLRLLHAAAIRDLGGRPGTLAEVAEVERYLSLCPRSAEGFEFLKGWAPSRRHEKKLEGLRGYIESLGGAAALPYIRAYWNGAFSILPPARHDAVRQEISGSLARILTSTPELALGDLELVAQGFRAIGDESGELGACDLIAERYPRTMAARNALERRWEIVDKSITPTSAAEIQAALKERFARAELLLDTLPYSPELHLRRFLLAREIDGVPNRDILRFGMALREVLGLPPRSDLSNPVPYLLIANEFAVRRLGTEILPELLDRGIDAIGHLKRQAGFMFPLGGEGKLRFLAELDAQAVLAWSLRAEAAVWRHDFATAIRHRDSARAVLREMAGVEKSDPRYPIHLSALARHLRCVGEIELAMGHRKEAFDALVSAKHWEARSTPGVYRTKRNRVDELLAMVGERGASKVGGVESGEAEPGAPVWRRELASFPELSLGDVMGGTFSTESWRGRVVVVSYWATWCGPCLSELRELERLRSRFVSRDAPVIQSINLDEDEARVRPFVDRHGIVVPVGMGAKHADLLPWATAGVVPQTLILDRQGVVRYRAVGLSMPDRWSAGAEQIIPALLGEASE